MRTTLQILDDRMEREQDTSHRPHLGASSIGGECERKTWYSFRWALEPDFTADVLRKFRDGHESEELIARELEQVVTLSGRQARFQDGHFGGSVDGIIEGGLVEAPNTPHIWNTKQSATSAFTSCIDSESVTLCSMTRARCFSNGCRRITHKLKSTCTS